MPSDQQGHILPRQRSVVTRTYPQTEFWQDANNPVLSFSYMCA
ncbi:MAG: hypothetical protein J07HR59_00069, partial [Halorubrum sp. J07HR59]